jgi:hypothetical protein
MGRFGLAYVSALSYFVIDNDNHANEQDICHPTLDNKPYVRVYANESGLAAIR